MRGCAGTCARRWSVRERACGASHRLPARTRLPTWLQKWKVAFDRPISVSPTLDDEEDRLFVGVYTNSTMLHTHAHTRADVLGNTQMCALLLALCLIICVQLLATPRS